MKSSKRVKLTDIEDICVRQFNVIKEWRRGIVADIDIYGCEKIAGPEADAKTRRFHVLVGLLLSSQTKDQFTFGAVKRLQSEIGLTPSKIRGTEVEVLADLIKPVGFYRIKAGYLKKISDILKENDDDIPDSVEELMKLPGIGPKMAYLTMQCAWDKCVGIGVDVHVHRISARLGWTKADECKTPEDTRKVLESLFNREYWKDINKVLIGFGQVQCLPVRPKCQTCPLIEECPFHNRK